MLTTAKPWCIVVDGDAVSAAPEGNVSASYNALFEACRGAGAVVRDIMFAGTQCDLHKAFPGGVCLFEPGLWPASAMAWFLRTVRKFPPCTVVYIDDVVASSQSLLFVENLRKLPSTTHKDIKIATPYPEHIHAVLEASHQEFWGGIPIIDMPHCVHPAFTTSLPRSPPRVQKCMLWGQQDSVHYPGRHRVAKMGAGNCDLIVAMPPPSYTTKEKTSPEYLAELMRSHACVYAGGDAYNVLTAKHLEAAACGACVITNCVTAEMAFHKYGLTFYGVQYNDPEFPEALTRCIAAHTPGHAEARNVAIVSKNHTPSRMAAKLQDLLLHTHSSSTHTPCAA